MDVFIPEARIDQFILEDVPYIDLTTELLGIGALPGEIEFFTREACVLCGTEEACRILAKLGAQPVFSLPSGTKLEAGQAFLRATGSAAALHKAWKVCLNVVDRTSAVATKTAAVVEAAHSANPNCEVMTTRKSMPGCKDLLTKAVTTGGAFPHRLGLSETVLVFAQHMEFMGGFEGLLEKLPQLKGSCAEKKVFVEADAQQALQLARAGVDGVQLDKVQVAELPALVASLRSANPHLAVVAAGGINASNAAAYAAAGVDALVTTAPFTASPVDMSARVTAVEVG